MRHIGQHARRRTVAATAGALAALAAALAALAIGGAQAASGVGCGDRITTDTTLRHDLVNCPNNGIIVGADNVALDLNGHTIDGNREVDKSCDPVKHFCDIGVAFARHHGVTVKGGSIRQFVAGVLAYRAKRDRILGVAARRNHVSGIGIASSRRILVRKSLGNGTRAAEGEGIGIFDSHRIRVIDSTFKNNAHVGIKPIGTVHGLVRGNLSAANGDEGFLMEGGADFRIAHNRVGGNGAGITLGPGVDNVITGNRVFYGRDGIRIEKGHGNLVARNLVVGTRKAGIRLGIPHPQLGGARNVVRGNRVRGSLGDGFLVGKEDRHSLLEGNLAARSGDDGIEVRGRFTRLARNRALNNGDFGIEASASAIDRGGNAASGNGHSPQCLHVACR